MRENKYFSLSKAVKTRETETYCCSLSLSLTCCYNVLVFVVVLVLRDVVRVRLCVGVYMFVCVESDFLFSRNNLC